MKTKSFLFLLPILALSTVLFVHPTIQADSVNTVSYTSIVNAHKNDIPSVPVRLTIPTAKIDADIEQVGLDGDKMAVPEKNGDVGWYEYGYRPGEKGNSVIAGHLDAKDGSPAVFWKLGLLRPNDIIYVKDKDGVTRSFKVSDIEEYTYDSVPMKTLFTKSLTSNLVLITCAGSYNTASHNYSNRLIVTATKVDSQQ